MKKDLFCFILSLSILIIFMGIGFAQPNTAPGGEPITVTGKIGYMQNADRYYVNCEKPPAVLLIVNPIPKILEALYKNGKTVTVEGHLAGGADLLYVEKIDGVSYMAIFLNR